MGKHSADQVSQQAGRRPDLVIFQKMNKIAQSSGIRPVRDCFVEWRRSAAAESTRRGGVGGIILSAKEFLAADAAQVAFKRDYLGKAEIADGQRRNVGKRKMADAAVRRKQDTKQAFSR